MRQSRSLLALACLLASSMTVDAFVPQNSHTFAVRPKTSLKATPELLDVAAQHLATTMDTVLTSSSTLLADAAAATLDASAALTTAVTDVANSEAVTAATEVVKEDVGWWQSYLNLFESALVFLHGKIDQPLRDAGFTQTWGVSIALFTAFVRSSLIPLSFQQSKSSEYMKALKPYMTEIKEKFKDNKDAQNRAIGKLYEDADQNPLAGCLFSLIQIPVFLGLYRGIRQLAIDGNLQEPFLFIPSLQGPVHGPDYRDMDWLLQGWSTVDGVLTPSLGWETTLAFLIMPVVLVLGQSLSMQVLQPPKDDNMSAEELETYEKSQVVLKFLPLLIGFFSLQCPAGLTIYWFTSNLFTVTQSLVVRSYYAANPPKIELPDYWEALDDLDAMSVDDKRKAAEAGISVGPKFDELLEEARFHFVIDRQPIREQSEAWKRAKSDSLKIPEDIEAWVNAAEPSAALDVADIESKDKKESKAQVATP